jgi:hypothetical protein
MVAVTSTTHKPKLLMPPHFPAARCWAGCWDVGTPAQGAEKVRHKHKLI